MFDNLVTYHILRSDELPAYDAIGYQYIMAGNGLFIRTQTRFFTAVIPVKHAIVRGLPLLKDRFRLLVPKLPESLLTAVFKDARLARRPDGDLNEVLYQFHHDGQTVQLKKPPQQATAVSVTSSTSNSTDENILCDLHSHGNMAAFWSETDDMDERNGRLYAVIGKVDSDKPEMRLRVGIYGYWMSLPVTALFADNPHPIDLHHPPKKENTI
jgi:PRTRC genetic system protein A